MAQVLKLTRNAVDTSLISLSGWCITDPGWMAVVGEYTPDAVPPPVVEVLTLRSYHATQDALAAAEIALHKLGRQAAAFLRDRSEQHPVWLYDQLSSETGPRQALVLSMRLENITEQHGIGSDGTGDHINPTALFRLAIIRGPWERTSSVAMNAATPRTIHFDSGSTEPTVGETITGNTSGDIGTAAWWFKDAGTWAGGNADGYIVLSDADGPFQDNEALNGSVAGNDFATADGTAGGGVGLVYDYSTTNPTGDMPARIAFMDFTANSSDLDRLWIGVRSEAKHPTIANYVPIWECEASTLNVLESGVTNETGDSTASNQEYVQVVETDLDWDDTWQKVYERQEPIDGGKEAENYGEALCLLRALVTAGTWEVQLRLQQGASGASIEGPIVEVSNTSWDFHEAGIFQFPIRDLRVIPTGTLADTFDANVYMTCYARRTSGAGNLKLDCFVKIPTDEAFIKVESAGVAVSSRLIVATGPQNATQAMSATATLFDDFGAASPSNWSLPPGDGRIFMAFARSANSTWADTVTINTSNAGAYYPRWHTLRGAE